ncbi:hypothetical protein AUG19_00155 [archaeon 13_1_20CM_2_54_9]|nr:MAG: hypothetical protein AUG19_00155 [archaeon 13_1_20CM_2_54_9]
MHLGGKRLDPLKTEEVKLLPKPEARGTFILRPRILYLDENGRYKSRARARASDGQRTGHLRLDQRTPIETHRGPTSGRTYFGGTNPNVDRIGATEA